MYAIDVKNQYLSVMPVLPRITVRFANLGILSILPIQLNACLANSTFLYVWPATALLRVSVAPSADPSTSQNRASVSPVPTNYSNA